MSDGDENSAALWIMRYDRPDYDLYDSEAEAATMAVYHEDVILHENGIPLGVQFDDGRVLRMEDWPRFAAERRDRAIERAAKAAVPEPAPRPVRAIRDPFEGKPLEVDAAEPAWLGMADAREAGKARGQQR
jgi:hypothetical protein